MQHELPSPTPAPVSRLAVVRLSSLGDVVLTTTVLDALGGLADAPSVAFVTRDSYTPLLAGDPRIETTIGFDPVAPEHAAAALAEFEPDAVLDLQVSLRSDRLVRSVPRARRIRMRKETLRRRLAVAGIRSLRAEPVADRVLDALARTLARDGLEGRPRLWLDPQRVSRAADHLPPASVRVGMSPGSQWSNKAWPIERFVTVAGAFAARDGVEVAIFFGPEETELAGPFSESPGVRIVAPDLIDLPAHLSHLDVLITGDSGPLHVAEAVGVPVVALFGPTTDQLGFGPQGNHSIVIERGLWCRPCHIHGGNRCPLGHHRCMLDIRVEEVMDTVDRLIGAVATPDT